MDFDPLITLAGFVVGFVVGLTGMGGGALMTPILVLLFNVQPLAAISSDLVASAVMKPVGAAVHLRRGTVHRGLVTWLVLGSVPAGFCGVLVLRALGDGETVQHRIKVVMGAILLVAAAAMLAKSTLDRRRAPAAAQTDPAGLAVRRLPTLAVGVLGGLVVGMTSVGSGSLIIVMLLMLYPRIRASQLVGTDLVQAVPLVASASLGHLLFGDFQLSLTGALLLGSLPGVYLGARLSSGPAAARLVRPALVLMISLSGLKLIGVPTEGLGAAAALMITAAAANLALRRLRAISSPIPAPTGPAGPEAAAAAATTPPGAPAGSPPDSTASNSTTSGSTTSGSSASGDPVPVPLGPAGTPAGTPFAAPRLPVD